MAGVLELVIDHPERAGAVSPGMMIELAEAVEAIDPNQGLVALIHSTATGAVCAGGDLRSVRENLLDRSKAAAMCDVMTVTLDRLATRCAYVVAAVEGPAVGGGAEILTCCDHIVVSEKASIGFVHASLGVSPGWGGARRLVRRVGRQKALRWLMEPGRRSSKACALEGMADQVVDTGTALAVARSLAEGITALPTASRVAAARLGKGAEANERTEFLNLWGGPAHLASLAAVRKGR
jgi:ethylmalonyl-CoA/methylmalonyl-CoA decarboxylase